MPPLPPATSLILLLLILLSPTLGVDFLFNKFNITNPGVLLVPDARVESTVIRLTNDSNRNSLGRAFYPRKFRPSSFSTSFVFSILLENPSSPGFGLAFVLSNWTHPPHALAGQYLGVYSNTVPPSQAPLLVVEFKIGHDTQFPDPDGNGNYLGINLNNIESAAIHRAGYYNFTGGFVPVNMRTGENIRAWVDFDSVNFEINVSVAPVAVTKPSLPTLSYRDPAIANYVSPEMYVGFSASRITWVEIHRILAWSFSDTGNLREINTTNLPVFTLPNSSSALSAGAISGITIGSLALVGVVAFTAFWVWRKNKQREEDADMEEWELEYWPHRFSYEELSLATNNFSKEQLLGSGGFGKVYKGTIPNSNNQEIAVKCVNHDSRQGLREFMAEISSIGRLQHKNLVQVRGWCKKSNQLLLVYDYMPNGSLDRYIFCRDENQALRWAERRRILGDVAEGLHYLHRGWEQVVIHRDIKPSNILLDAEMRGRLGDFGLAKLFSHDGVPNTTRVVGTLGYMAPELASMAVPMSASDVYSFGVVMLEVVSGKKPIQLGVSEEEDVVLVDWVRELYGNGKLAEAADGRLKLEEEWKEEVEGILKLGLACCHPDPSKRPTMKEVVAILVGEGNDAFAATTPTQLPTELARGGGDGSNSGNGD